MGWEVPGKSSPLIGRDTVLDALNLLLDRAITGHGGASSLVASPGMGKTAVLDRLADDATARDVRLLRLTGSPADTDLPWAGLSALCIPHRDRFERLPGPQGRALHMAFALLASDAPPDRLAVSLGALGVLSAVATERPLLVIVDDLHWLDRESRLAIDFIARRLADDPIAVVTASRPDGLTPPGPVIELPGLDEAALDTLLTSVGVSAPSVRSEIAAAADGNPLLAVEVARTISADERSGARALQHPLPVPSPIDAVFSGRLDGLDPACRQALLLLATLPTDLDASDAATPGLGVDPSVLEAAETAGLVEFAPGGVRFAHPLARSAVYHGASAADRRRAHEQVAATVGPASPRGILHRALAAVRADDALAEDLACLGADTERRGAPIAAADRYVRAAELTSATDRRADLLMRAAAAALDGGAVRRAGDLMAQAAAVDPPRTQRIDARRVEVHLATAAGRYADAKAIALAADAELSATDPYGVADVLLAVARTVLPVDPMLVLDLCDRAWELAHDAPAPTCLYAEILYGAAQIVRLDFDAIRHVERWPELLDHLGPVVAGPFLAETVAMYFSVLGRPEEALAVLERVEPAIRQASASSALVPVLATRGHILYNTDLQAAASAALRAWDLADAGGTAGLAPGALHALLMAAAAIGDADTVERAATQAAASGTVLGTAYAHFGRARLALGAGRPETAVSEFEQLHEIIGDRNPTICRFEGDELEALVRVGRHDDARRLSPVLASIAHVGPWARGQHERSLGLLADDIDEAVAHFAAADEAYRSKGQDLALGRNELVWGERLRRAKRRAEARRHLQRAVEIFDRLGASAFRRQAVAELTAAGGTDDRRCRPTNCSLPTNSRWPGSPSVARRTATSRRNCSSARAPSRTISLRCTESSG